MSKNDNIRADILMLLNMRRECYVSLQSQDHNWQAFANLSEGLSSALECTVCYVSHHRSLSCEPLLKCL